MGRMRDVTGSAGSPQHVDRYSHDGLSFDVRCAGPKGGDPVVLLHGFPQDSSAWAGVVPVLHRNGMRTLAPDQRGYSRDARPSSVRAYAMPWLVGDVIALLDAAGLERAHIVGHDWGGLVAWAMAAWHPDRVTALTVLSTPHPAALRWAVRHAGQAWSSWYIAAFQVPVVPEVVLAAMLRRGGLTRTGLPAADGARYAQRLGTRQALRGPINWYRGARSAPAAQAVGEITVPTTFVWGTRDPFLGRAAAERTAGHVVADYRFVEVEAGHWLPERRPAQVAEAILSRGG